MVTDSSRNCPICGDKASGVIFPYRTQFNDVHFKYLKCGGCSSVFVDPVPDSRTFEKMYAKANYHDLYYEGNEGGDYSESAHLLRQYLPPGSRVLDYGCGVGTYLKALTQEGFIPYGVEFDEDAARFAGRKAGCETFSVNRFVAQAIKPQFDAIHLGDVLEHLPDPGGTLRELLCHLKSGGLLFVEGPLEINPCAVYWATRIFGAIKHILRPDSVASHAPTHLFRIDAKQQLAFLQRAEPRLDLRFWCVYETGWPYASGGAVKRAIASIAMRMGGKRLFEMTFGNRFRGVFAYRQAVNGIVHSDSDT